MGFLPAAGFPPTIVNIQTSDPGLPENLQERWDQKIIAGFVQRHSMDFLLTSLRKIVEGSQHMALRFCSLKGAIRQHRSRFVMAACTTIALLLINTAICERQVYAVDPTTLTQSQLQAIVEKAFDEETTVELTMALVAAQRLKVTTLINQERADINAKGNFGVRPIHFVTDCGTLDSVKLALEFKADPNVVSQSHLTPLYLATKNPESFGKFKLLLANGADLSLADEHAMVGYNYGLAFRLLRHSWKDGRYHVELAENFWWYLDHGGDIDARLFIGMPILEYLHMRNSFEFIHVLLSRGANPFLDSDSYASKMKQEYYTRMADDPDHWLEKIRQKLTTLEDNNELKEEAKRKDNQLEKLHQRYPSQIAIEAGLKWEEMEDIIKSLKSHDNSDR